MRPLTIKFSGRDLVRKGDIIIYPAVLHNRIIIEAGTLGYAVVLILITIITK